MSPFALPRRLSRLCLLLLGTVFATSASADQPLQVQRAAFKQALALAEQGGNDWRAAATGLKDYALYPYLEAASLSHDIDQLDLAQVQDYLQRYPELIPAADLRRDFLLKLAERKDWADFDKLYRPGMGDALACDALQARLAGGGKLTFQRDLSALWRSPNLPAACDPVLDAAHRAGLLTKARLWARIDSALDARQAATISVLAAWLPHSEAPAAKRLAQALSDPAAAAAAARHWPNTPRHRQAVSIALQRLARRDAKAADSAWLKLRHRFSFSQAQRGAVLAAAALFHATDFDPGSLQRLQELPVDAQTDATREWRVRVALASLDWRAVLAGIDNLSPSQQANGEWRYFRARALTELGKTAKAAALLDALAGEATYFGFLAADRTGRSYAICPLALDGDPALAQSLLANRGMQRALELFAVDMPHAARREWVRALSGANTATRREAALLATQRGWYDRAVFTFSSGEDLRRYTLRFPLASQDGVVPQAREAGIDPAWAYAIARAESAWMSDAHSAADARGLMQLLPATAEQVARSHGLAWNGGDSLYDPAVNVILGTRYLAQMAQRYNGAPWLASAAYNAGPVKLDQWLAARSDLPPDVFTATIPYFETREYVARVMAFSVIYDWRLNGSVVPLDTRMPPISQPYAPPGPGAVRKAVSCPTDDTAAPAAVNPSKPSVVTAPAAATSS